MVVSFPRPDSPECGRVVITGDRLNPIPCALTRGHHGWCQKYYSADADMAGQPIGTRVTKDGFIPPKSEPAAAADPLTRQLQLFRRAITGRQIQPGQPVNGDYLARVCGVRTTAQEGKFSAALEKRNWAQYDRKSDQYLINPDLLWAGKAAVPASH